MPLYNNGYPATYPQYYPQFQQSTQNQQNGKIWVIGRAGANAYLVAPNSSVDLWDSESPVIYVKSADASGMPSIKILDYTVRQTDKTAPITASVVEDNNSINYATKSEIEGITQEIAALRKQVERLKKRKEEEDDE